MSALREFHRMQWLAFALGIALTVGLLVLPQAFELPFSRGYLHAAELVVVASTIALVVYLRRSSRRPRE